MRNIKITRPVKGRTDTQAQLDENNLPVEESKNSTPLNITRAAKPKPPTSEMTPREALQGMPDLLGRTVDTQGFDIDLSSTDVPIYADKNIEAQLERDQSAFGLFANTIARGASTVVLGGAEALSYFADAENIGMALQEGEKDYSNWFADLMEKAQEEVREVTPIYRSERGQQDFAWDSATWWANNIESIATTASMFIPTAGIMRGLAFAGKTARGLLNATKVANVAQDASKITKGLNKLMYGEKAESLLRTGASATVSRYMENTMEANETFNSVYQELIAEGVSEQEARLKAGEAAANTWKANWINIATDLVQYGSLTKGLNYAAPAAKGLRKQLAKGGYDYIKNAAGEGLEEFGQYVISQESARAAKNDRSFFELEGLDRRMSDYVKDPEAQASALLGAVGGTFFKAAGSTGQLYNRLSGVYEAQDADLAKRTFLDKLDVTNSYLVDGSILMNQAVQYGNAGKFSSLRSFYQDLAGKTDQELEAEGLTPEQIEDKRKKDTEILSDLDFLEREYTRLTEDASKDNVVKIEELGSLYEKHKLAQVNDTITSEKTKIEEEISNQIDTNQLSIKNKEYKLNSYKKYRDKYKEQVGKKEGSEGVVSYLDNKIEQLEKEIAEEKQQLEERTGDAVIPTTSRDADLANMNDQEAYVDLRQQESQRVIQNANTVEGKAEIQKEHEQRQLDMTKRSIRPSMTMNAVKSLVNEKDTPGYSDLMKKLEGVATLAEMSSEIPQEGSETFEQDFKQRYRSTPLLYREIQRMKALAKGNTKAISALDKVETAEEFYNLYSNNADVKKIFNDLMVEHQKRLEKKEDDEINYKEDNYTDAQDAESNEPPADASEDANPAKEGRTMSKLLAQQNALYVYNAQEGTVQFIGAENNRKMSIEDARKLGYDDFIPGQRVLFTKEGIPVKHAQSTLKINGVDVEVFTDEEIAALNDPSVDMLGKQLIFSVPADVDFNKDSARNADDLLIMVSLVTEVNGVEKELKVGMIKNSRGLLGSDPIKQLRQSIFNEFKNSGQTGGVFKSSIDTVRSGGRVNEKFNSTFSKKPIPPHILNENYLVVITDTTADGTVKLIDDNVRSQLPKGTDIDYNDNSKLVDKKGNVFILIQTPNGDFKPVRMKPKKLSQLPKEQAVVNSLIDALYDKIEDPALSVSQKFQAIKEFNKNSLNYIPYTLYYDGNKGKIKEYRQGKDGVRVFKTGYINRAEAKDVASKKVMRFNVDKMNTGSYNADLSKKGWYEVNIDPEMPFINSMITMHIDSVPDIKATKVQAQPTTTTQNLVEKRKKQLEKIESQLNPDTKHPIFNVGQKYNDGMKVEAEFDDQRTDKTKEGVSVISRVRKPATVDSNGVMTSAAKVEVTWFDSLEQAKESIASRYEKAKANQEKKLAEAEAQSTTEKTTYTVEDIQELSKNSEFIKLSEDGTHYVNTKTGKKYQRVTQYLSKDETRKEAEGDQKKILESSQEIGNKVDVFIRDFFAGELNVFETYGLADVNILKDFIKELENVKSTLEARGETIIPNDIVLYNDELGIAGTVDLISVDKDGNVRIYDIKSKRSGVNYINSTKYGKSDFQKWTEQLSLYRILLNNTHGIKASTLGILPVKVNYKGGDVSTTELNLLKGISITPKNQVGDAKLIEEKRQVAPTSTQPTTETTVEIPVNDMTIVYNPQTGEMTFKTSGNPVTKETVINKVLVRYETQQGTIRTATYNNTEYKILSDNRIISMSKSNTGKEKWIKDSKQRTNILEQAGEVVTPEPGVEQSEEKTGVEKRRQEALDSIELVVGDFDYYIVPSVFEYRKFTYREDAVKAINEKYDAESAELENVSTTPTTETQPIITESDRIIWGHPGLGKTTAREQRDDIIDFDTDIKPRVAERLGLPEDKQNSKDLNAWRKRGKEKRQREFNQAMREAWAEAKQEAADTGKRLVVSDMIFLREFADDFDKVITTSEEIFTQRATKRGDAIKDLSSWKKNIDESVSQVDESKVVSTDKYFSELFESPTTEETTTELEVPEKASILEIDGLFDVQYGDEGIIGEYLPTYEDAVKRAQEFDAQQKAAEEGEVVSKKEYDAFVNDGTVDQARINTIADKIIRGQGLSIREQAILADRTKEVEERIQEVAKQTEENDVSAEEPTVDASMNTAIDFTGETSSLDNLNEDPDEKDQEEDGTKYREATDPDGSYEKWNEEKEVAWFKKHYPNVPLEVLDDLRKIVGEGGPESWGLFRNASVYIANNAKKGTLYHEAFHVVFNLMLTDAERKQILEEGATKAKGAIAIEEYWADEYMEYQLSDSASAHTLPAKVADFFKRLWHLIRIAAERTGFANPASMNDYMYRVSRGLYNKGLIRGMGGVKFRNSVTRFRPKEIENNGLLNAREADVAKRLMNGMLISDVLPRYKTLLKMPHADDTEIIKAIIKKGIRDNDPRFSVQALYTNVYQLLKTASEDKRRSEKDRKTLGRLLESFATEIDPNIKVETVQRYSVQDVQNNSNKIFIFGDNTLKRGKGGQAVIRNEPNAFGIATKLKPSNAEGSFMTDVDLDLNKQRINSDIKDIKRDGRDVVFPKDGLGTGLAQLKIKAPKTYEFLVQRLQEEFGFNNETGEVTPLPKQPVTLKMKRLYIKAARSLQYYGIRMAYDTGSVDTTNDNIEESDLLEETEDVIENWMVKEKFISAKEKFSQKSKALFSMVPVKNAKFGGYPVFETPAHVFNKLSSRLSDSKNLEDMKRKLDNLINYNPGYKVIKNALTSEDSTIATEFWKNIGQRKFTPFLVLQNNGKRTRTFIGNEQDARKDLKATWQQNFFDSQFYDVSNNIIAPTAKFDEKYEVLSRVVNEIKEENKKNRLDKEGNISRSQAGEIYNILKFLSIPVTRDEVVNMFSTPDNGENVKGGKERFLQFASGLTYYMNRIKKGENPYDGNKEASDNFDDMMEVYMIAYPETYQATFRTGEGELAYSFLQSRFMQNFMRELQNPNKKERDAFIKERMEDPFYKNSPFLSRILEIPDLAGNMRMSVFDALRTNDGSAIPYTKLTRQQLEALKMNAFFNLQFGGKTDTAYGYFMMPIFSDSTSSAFLRFKKYTTEEAKAALVNSARQERDRIEWLEGRIKPVQKEYNKWLADQNNRNKPYKEKAKLPEELKDIEYNMLKNGLKYQIFRGLNDMDLSTESQFEDAVMNMIQENLNNELRSLIEEGVFDKDGNDTTGMLDERILDEKVKRDNLTQYVYNTMVMNIQTLVTFGGDTAFYKAGKDGLTDFTDVYKRIKEIWSPGDYLNADSSNKYVHTKEGEISEIVSVRNDYKVIYVKDPGEVENIVSESIEELKRIHKNNPKKDQIIKAFSELNNTDAATIIDPIRAREIHLGSKGLNASLYEMYDSLMTGKTIRHIGEEATSIVYKPFQFMFEKSTDKNNTTRFNPVQHKNAEFLMTPSMAVGNPKLEKMMEKFGYVFKKDGSWTYDSSKRITDAVMYTTAVKVGEKGTIDNIEDAVETDAHTFKNANYRIQMETPEHHIDTDIMEGTQYRKLIIENVDSKTEYTLPDGTKVKGDKLVKDFNEAIYLNVKESYEELKKLFYDEETGLPDNKKVLTALREQAIEQELPDDFLTALDFLENNEGYTVDENGNLKKASQVTVLPLWHPDIVYQVESMMNSFFKNRVTKQRTDKSAGASLYNASSWGFENENPKGLRKPKIKFSEDGGIEYMEAIMPVTSEALMDYADENGFIDIKKIEEIEPDLLKGVFYRIPTEHKYSMFHIKVIGFLPQGVAGQIILPDEATTLAGLDFDIDKLYGLLYNIEVYGQPLPEKEIAYQNYINSSNFSKKLGRDIIRKNIPNFDDARARREFAAKEGLRWNADENVFTKKSLRKVESSMDTKKGRDNLKLDIAFSILSNKRTAVEQTTPGGFETLKDLVDMILAAQGADKGQINPMLNSTVREIHNRMMTGLDLIGIFANHTVNHSLMTLGNVAFTKPIKFNGKELAGLSQMMVGDVNIADLKEFLAAAVDNGKDPVASFLNVTTITADLVAAMVRVGHPIEAVMMFTANPVLKDFTNRLSKKGNTYSTTITDTINEIQSELEVALKKVAGTTQANKILDKGLSSLYLTYDRKTKKGNLLDSIEKSNMSAEDLIKEKDLNEIKLRLTVISSFRNLMKNQASDLKTVMSAMRYDSSKNAAGPTVAHTKNRLDRYDSALEIKGITGFRQLISDIELNPERYVAAFREYGLKEAIKIIGEVTNIPYASTAESNIFNFTEKTIKQYIVPEGRAINPDDTNKIYRAIETLIATSYDTFKPAELKRVVENLPSEISNFISANEDSPYVPFLRHFMAIPSKQQKALAIMKFTRNGVDKIQQTDIKNDWYSMVNDSDTEVSRIANDLVKYAFATSGYVVTPFKFTDMIPVMYTSELREPGKKRFVESTEDIYSKDMFDYENSSSVAIQMIDQILRNMYRSFSFVQYIDPDQVKPYKVNGTYRQKVWHEDVTKKEKGETFQLQYIKTVINDKQGMRSALMKAIDSEGDYIIYEQVQPLGLYNEMLEFDYDSAVLNKPLVSQMESLEYIPTKEETETKDLTISDVGIAQTMIEMMSIIPNFNINEIKPVENVKEVKTHPFIQ